MKLNRFEIKVVLFGYFGLEFQKFFIMFEISTLDFIKNKFLTNTVNFGIGLDFSKIPGSAFNDDPGLG